MAKESSKDGPQLYLRCEWCGEFFEYNGGKRRRYCTQACKQAAWRRAGGGGNSAGPLDTREPTGFTGLHMCLGYMHAGTFIHGVCNQCGEKQEDSD